MERVGQFISSQHFRSGSVSRGLQVEEDDLIQFSESQGDKSKKLVKLKGPSDELEDMQEQEDDKLVENFLVYLNLVVIKLSVGYLLSRRVFFVQEKMSNRQLAKI